MYREKASKSEKRKAMNGAHSQEMVPRKAYVEDAMEGDDSQAVAIVDVPPRAPTPPPTSELPPSVNVFDFLVSDATPNGASKEIQAAERSMPGQFPANGAESQYSQYSQYSNGDGSYYAQNGFSYGHTPLAPEFSRYDSYNNLLDSQTSQAALMPPPTYVTPAPKEHRKDKSDKKRKRHVEDLDLSSSAKRPSSRDEMMLDAPKSAGRVLHSGLTGGLSKLVTDKDFYDDRIEAGPTPISPLKRSKRDDKDRKKKADRRKSSYTSYTTTTTTSKPPSSSKHNDDRHEKRRSHRSLSPQESQKHDSRRYEEDRHRLSRAPRESFSSQDTSRPQRRQLRQIDYPSERPGSVQPSASNQVSRSVGSSSSSSRADLFMSFVTKGPESQSGYSVNKLLKRYHRERDVRGEEEKGEEDKELWKGLRLRRNSRGEIVLFKE